MTVAKPSSYSGFPEMAFPSSLQPVSFSCYDGIALGHLSLNQETMEPPPGQSSRTRQGGVAGEAAFPDWKTKRVEVGGADTKTPPAWEALAPQPSPTGFEDTGLTQLQLRPSAPSFLISVEGAWSMQLQSVAEGKHTHHRTPSTLSGTRGPPRPARPFSAALPFCCGLRAPSAILFLGSDPFHPSLPVHHHPLPPSPPHLSSSPPLWTVQFPPILFPFLPLRTRHRQRLEISIRSLPVGFLAWC